MVKTREFGQPCAMVAQEGKCRICRKGAFDEGQLGRARGWADETHTLCDTPACIAEAKREIGRL